MKKGQTNPLIIVAIVLIAGFFIFNFLQRGQPVDDWQGDYSVKSDIAGIDKTHSMNNNLIDITPSMQQLANDIADESINSRDAIRKTMEWVYQNVEYSRKTTANECFEETASDVYEKGIGDCVSMTKLAVSLLRAQGIAARPAGGCISSKFQCDVLFAISPERIPKFEPVDPDDPKKRGGLHEWLEIWLPEEGWIIGEATSGQFYKRDCVSYDRKDYNTDNIGMCIITDKDYVNQCAKF